MSLLACLAPKRLSLRLLLVIGLATGVILVGIVWLHYRASRDLLVAQARTEALKQVRAAAASLDAALPRALAAYQEAIGPEPSADLVPFLANLLAAAPREEVYGCYVAFEAKDRSGNSVPARRMPTSCPRSRPSARPSTSTVCARSTAASASGRTASR